MMTIKKMISNFLLCNIFHKNVLLATTDSKQSDFDLDKVHTWKIYK